MENRIQEDSLQFPADKLNYDVLRLIFQNIIDEEADEFMRHVYEPNLRAKAATMLALVCRRWWDIVYSTPSLWPIISLNLWDSLNQTQAKFNRLIGLSKTAPVDLSVTGIHYEYEISTLGHNDNCSCKGGKIRVDLSRIVNVRRLRLSFTQAAACSLLKLPTLKFLDNVTTLQFITRHRSVATIPLFDLGTILQHIPRLREMFLYPAEHMMLSTDASNCFLLPMLQVLKIGAYQRNSESLTRLPQFLSHSPNLENLQLSFASINGDILSLTTPITELAHLRKISTRHFNAAYRLFSKGRIYTPKLLEFICEDPIYGTEFDKLKDFLSLYPLIRILRLTIQGGLLSASFLSRAMNVEELILEGSSPSLWLDRLYTVPAESVIETPDRICPNLQNLTLVIPSASFISPQLDSLVKIRCLPVNERGYTAEGYKAISVLTLESRDRQTSFSSLSNSMAWKSAELTKISDSRYELRWTYYPG